MADKTGGVPKNSFWREIRIPLMILLALPLFGCAFLFYSFNSSRSPAVQHDAEEALGYFLKSVCDNRTPTDSYGYSFPLKVSEWQTQDFYATLAPYRTQCTSYTVKSDTLWWGNDVSLQGTLDFGAAGKSAFRASLTFVPSLMHPHFDLRDITAQPPRP